MFFNDEEQKRNEDAICLTSLCISQYLILLFDDSIAILKSPILEVFTISTMKERRSFSLLRASRNLVSLPLKVISALWTQHLFLFFWGCKGFWELLRINRALCQRCFMFPLVHIQSVHSGWKISLPTFLCKIFNGRWVKWRHKL